MTKNLLLYLRHSSLLLVIAFVLAACSRTDPEKALRNAVSEIEAAVKSKDTAKFASYLADDFARTGSGGMNKQEARRTVAAVLLTNPNVYMNVTIKNVSITGDNATATMVVVAGGGSGIIPERAQSWDFTTKWRYESNKWLVYSADWKELL
jgi:ketosteroid isomerase-like protein